MFDSMVEPQRPVLTTKVGTIIANAPRKMVRRAKASKIHVYGTLSSEAIIAAALRCPVQMAWQVAGICLSGHEDFAVIVLEEEEEPCMTPSKPRTPRPHGR
jgi:hypothetical protein